MLEAGYSIRLRDFNPRSPWGERQRRDLSAETATAFQSTLPVGGATSNFFTSGFLLYISIHAPRGGSDLRRVRPFQRVQISIHAPRGGSDSIVDSRKHFVSISIHAPRGGSDNCQGTNTQHNTYFNPRSPWGERPAFYTIPGIRWTFQSTLPVGGATCFSRDFGKGREISIHAPRGGSDIGMPTRGIGSRNFNPRSPWGERRVNGTRVISWYSFQSTLPVGGATTNPGSTG